MTPPTGRRLGWRLVVTVVLVYAIHFATDVVRETYLAVALGDHLSVRVDEYAGLHPDLFEITGRGVFINNNPGASLLGAVPYAIARPGMTLLFRWKPALVAPKPAATYDDPRPNRTKFMNAARAQGVDIKLGLAAASMHIGLMVPLAALATLVMFRFLSARLDDERLALWFSLLYAFGTPIFFRSAFLNQNVIVAHAILFSYVWLVGLTARRTEDTIGTRTLLGAGVMLGVALLADYSAVPLLLAFGAWSMARGWRSGGRSEAVRSGGWLVLGGLGPVLLLLGYQWVAFGSPFLPAQAYMPSTQLSTHGWYGFVPPQPALLWDNLFDLRFGLFAFCPMLVAAVAAPWVRQRLGGPTAWELGLIFTATLALYLFNSSVEFARLQWNTGIRYMVPAVPLLFIALVPVLLKLPRWLALSLVVPTVFISWSVAMVRESVPVALTHVLGGGLELPWLTVLQKTAAAYAPRLAQGASPVPIFLVVGLMLWLLWRPRSLRGTSPAAQ